MTKVWVYLEYIAIIKLKGPLISFKYIKPTRATRIIHTSTIIFADFQIILSVTYRTSTLKIRTNVEKLNKNEVNKHDLIIIKMTLYPTNEE